ncbi:MAG TPA: alpha/beta hydrolase, partial [Longimicrobiaceae bacterium]|nr:alpha/beta hydrolase [Longimicrobiaceae bacterium]
MRILPLAAALLTLAAPPLAAQGGFLLIRGSDTVIVERFSRAPRMVEGRVLAQKRVPLTYRATLAADATVERLEVRVLQPGASDEAAPRQAAVLVFRGDSALAETRTGDSVRVERIATERGALPYHPQIPMVSLLEQIVRRARALGGERARVPVLLLGAGGRTVEAVVERRGADSVRVVLGSIDAALRVNAEGAILGGRAQGEQVIERVPSIPDRLLATTPLDYTAPAGAPYTAEPVRIRTAAGHTLAGTLTLPKGARGPVPAVVTITGSSPQDRDNNTPYGGPYRIFRQVADTLGRREIAVLRMDDRGIGESTGDFASATTADRADDIRAGIAYLRGRGEIDGWRVALVGLSEGGMIAPMIAAADTGLAGIVLLAGPGSTGREVMEYQFRYGIEQAGSIRPEQRDSVYRAQLAEAEALRREQPWVRFFWDYDPLATARRVGRVPVLVLQGTTDR